MSRRSVRAASVAIISFLAIAASSAADATTYYLKSVKFSDGTSATGWFSTGITGYPEDHDITTVNGAINGYHYIHDINVTYAPGDSSITVYYSSPAYGGFLTLTTASPIDTGGTQVLVLGGVSHECADFSCPRGIARNVVAGRISTSASVPEPATWGLMIAGFSGIGFGLRTARRRRLALA